MTLSALQLSRIFILDAVFMAKRKICSLPEFHGARWSAWLRYGCKACASSLGNILLGVLPMRNGQAPIYPEEVVFLRLIVKEEGLEQLGLLAEYLMKSGIYGEFSPHSFELLFWRDIVGGQNYAPSLKGRKLITPFTAEIMEAEISALIGLATFTLHFYVPLRLKLPSGYRKGSSGISMYCQPEFFATPESVAHLATMIRFCTPYEPACYEPLNLEVALHNLEWKDMRYNQSRQISLGGVVGTVRLKGQLGSEMATLLVLGQYFGAGKNPLFGLGYWNIPEIRKFSKIPVD